MTLKKNQFKTKYIYIYNLINLVMYDIFPLMDNAKYVYNYSDDLDQLQFVYNLLTKVLMKFVNLF